jgi:hypothetical protein
VTNEGFTDAGVHPLVPIKDSLQSLKIHVKQSLECLTTLLNNNGDMLWLLLTEQRQVEPIGVIVSPEHCEDAELLLGAYAHELNNILFEINCLLQRLREFATLALADYGYRNHIS